MESLKLLYPEERHSALIPVHGTNRGSALLWVLLLAAAALLVGGGTSRLLWQREAIKAGNHALLRASTNADNGVEWARARWLEAQIAEESSLPSSAVWLGDNEADYAHITFQQMADNSWALSSIGFFAPQGAGFLSNSRRRTDANLPPLNATINSSLAVTGTVSGSGSCIYASAYPKQNFLVKEAVLPGVSMLSYEDKTAIMSSSESAFALHNIANVQTGTIPSYLGPFIISHDPDDDSALLELHSYTSYPGHLWAESSELFDVILCDGYLSIGSEPDRSISLSAGKLVFIADTIDVYGSFQLGDSAEIWLLAHRDISWYTLSGSPGLFRGCMWSQGNVRIYGNPESSWEIVGAIYTTDLLLDNINLYFCSDPAAGLPRQMRPRLVELPVATNWRILVP